MVAHLKFLKMLKIYLRYWNINLKSFMDKFQTKIETYWTGEFSLFMRSLYMFSQNISVRRGKIAQFTFMRFCIQMDAIGMLF